MTASQHQVLHLCHHCCLRYLPGPLSDAGTYDLRICCNGVLSGLVIVTCMCGFVDPWAAVVCSAVAGALYAGASWLLLRVGIDDPLDSSAVHLGSGILGSIMVAFVANPKHVYALTGSPCGGVFYGPSGWVQLGMQLLGIVVVIVFAGGTAWIMFWLLNKRGLLRVDQTTELAGIDNMEHGGGRCRQAAGMADSGLLAACSVQWHQDCLWYAVLYGQQSLWPPIAFGLQVPLYPWCCLC